MKGLAAGDKGECTRRLQKAHGYFDISHGRGGQYLDVAMIYTVRR